MDNVDILQYYLNKISDNTSVRVYTDGTCAISAYIGNKNIHIEGDYNTVLFCIKALKREYVE